MTEAISTAISLWSAPGELPEASHIWGTGGWLAPEQREALDWLTLCRLLGWQVEIQRTNEPPPSKPAECRCVLMGCDPATVSVAHVDWLEAQLAVSPLLVIMRADSSNGNFSEICASHAKAAVISGRDLFWRGPGIEKQWHCRKPLTARPLQVDTADEVWATLDGEPVIAARRMGRGIVAVLGFHPSEARDSDGAASALLRHLLVWGSQVPVAWFDFSNTMVLRMDDPGGAQNIHNRSWYHEKLSEANWQAIGAELQRRNARMSIAYSAGWVDDGDPVRGSLRIDGTGAARCAGAIHDSPLVIYEDVAGHAPGTRHDYTAEYRGIQKLRDAGLTEVELHGYTHMHPDTRSWAGAADRYENVSWFRELGRGAQSYLDTLARERHPLVRAFAAFDKYFHKRPTTLIAPGEQLTNDALERALENGIELVGSYYLALRHGERFCWSQHVCAPYLDKSETAWFDSELPVVGYFHDRDLALCRVGWMSDALERWQAAGAKRFIDYHELAAILGREMCLTEQRGQLILKIQSTNAHRLVRSVKVRVRIPSGRLPSVLSLGSHSDSLTLRIEADGEASGQVLLPATY